MAILAGDLKLVASQNMDDVPEGGGAPTGVVVGDGVSNAIFPDISELDRAGGRVNLRKVHVHVQTDDRDTFLGSNIIVAEPPEDPKVSITLFTSGDTFDRRTAAASRIESYLNRGPSWAGFLYENHIEGQRSIQIFQRPSSELPLIGQTIALITDEGLPTEVIQYVRTTVVTSEIQTFYDPASSVDFQAAVVTCTISDALRYDFIGSPPARSFMKASNAAKLRDTVVSDAGTYAGVSTLTEEAEIGDFSVLTTGIYSQLVPSAQTETALTDLKPNGERVTYVPAGAPVVLTTAVLLDTTHSMSLGQPILPNSLSIVTSGVTLTDSGGQLIVSGTQVGTVDYANGIIVILQPASSYPASKVVTYTPAAAPLRFMHTASWAVTAESRSTTYVDILDPVPAPGTLTASYRAQGRWYSLTDDGNGQITSAFGASVGAGTINFTTGSLVLTFAALPDVGSKVLVTYGLTTAETTVPTRTLKAQSTFTLAHGGVAPSTVTIEWMAGVTAKTATDDGEGLLTGDATGTVDYNAGIIKFIPTVLPSAGAEISIEYSWGAPIVENFVAPERIAPDGHIEIDLANPNVMPRTIKVEWNTVFDEADLTIEGQITTKTITTMFNPRRDPIVIVEDDGEGTFKTRPECDATINYSAGTISFTPDTFIALPKPKWKSVVIGSNVVDFGWGTTTTETSKTIFDGFEYQTIGAIMPTDLSAYVKVSYRTTASGTTGTEVFDLNLQVDLTEGSGDPIVADSASFTIGTTKYVDRQGSLISAIDPSTGAGTASGSLNHATGVASLTVLSVGTTNSGPLLGLVTAQSPIPVTGVSFRTSTAPIRPSSFTIQFVIADDEDETSHVVSADSGGIIESDNIIGAIDYETGVVDVYFGKWEVAAGNESEPWYDADKIVLGRIFVAAAVMADTIRYAAVAYKYLPLDAALLGIDPVRLPTDGRVPIFRAGGFAVVGHTASITATVSNAQVIDCARVRLSRVRVIGDDGVVINTGYTADLEAGTVTFTDVAGYDQPVTIEHRIEDMAVVSDVQINGEVTFTRALTHDYPEGSFLSSALVPGDLKSRVSIFFDQATWNGTTWLDALSGSAATGTYNDILAPVVVTNRGCLTERWALVFTTTQAFNIVGEHVGVIGTGSINTDCAPLNPATSTPYFEIDSTGWGSGWSIGNILRFNTVGAMTPVWVVRTVQQGPNTGTEHSFTLLSRGDVDSP